MDPSSEIDGGLTTLEEFLLIDTAASTKNSLATVKPLSSSRPISPFEADVYKLETGNVRETAVSPKTNDSNQDISPCSTCHTNSDDGSHYNGNKLSPNGTDSGSADSLKSDTPQDCMKNDLVGGSNSVTSRRETQATETNDACDRQDDVSNEIQEEWAINMDTIFKNGSEEVAMSIQDNESTTQKAILAQPEEQIFEEAIENICDINMESKESTNNEDTGNLTGADSYLSKNSADSSKENDTPPQNIYDVLRTISMDDDLSSTESGAGSSKVNDSKDMDMATDFEVSGRSQSNNDKMPFFQEICTKNDSSGLDNVDMCTGQAVKINCMTESDKSLFASHEMDATLDSISCDDSKDQTVDLKNSFVDDNKILCDNQIDKDISDMKSSSLTSAIETEDESTEIKLNTKLMDTDQKFLHPQGKDAKSIGDTDNMDDDKVNYSTDVKIVKKKRAYMTADRLFWHEIPPQVTSPRRARNRFMYGTLRESDGIKTKSGARKKRTTSSINATEDKEEESVFNDGDSNVEKDVTINSFKKAAMNLLSLKVELEQINVLPGAVVKASSFIGEGKVLDRDMEKGRMLARKRKAMEGRSSSANNKRRKLTKSISPGSREVNSRTVEKHSENRCKVESNEGSATVNSGRKKIGLKRGPTDVKARKSLNSGKWSSQIFSNVVYRKREVAVSAKSNGKNSQGKLYQNKTAQHNRIKKKSVSNIVHRSRVKSKPFESNKTIKKRSSSLNMSSKDKMQTQERVDKLTPIVVNLRSFDRGRNLRSRDKTIEIATVTVQDLKRSNQPKRKSQNNKKIKPVPESPPHNPTIPVVELDRDADGEYESFNLGAELGLKPEPDLSPDIDLPKTFGRARRKKTSSAKRRQKSETLPSSQNQTLNKDCDLSHSCCQKNMVLKVDCSTQWEDPSQLCSSLETVSTQNISPVVALEQIPTNERVQKHNSDVQQVEGPPQKLCSLLTNQQLQGQQPAQNSQCLPHVELLRKPENKQSLLKPNASSTSLAYFNVTPTQQAVIILPEERADNYHKASSLLSTSVRQQAEKQLKIQEGNTVVYQSLPEETGILKFGADSRAATFGNNMHGVSNKGDWQKKPDKVSPAISSRNSKSQFSQRGSGYTSKNDSASNNPVLSRIAESRPFDKVIVQESDSDSDEVVFIE